MDHTNLPTFLSLGVAKTGSTSLRRYLEQHPNVFIPEVLEPSYFASDNIKRCKKGVSTLDEYKKLFESAQGESALGEISPAYFESQTACQEIFRAVPNVKIVVFIRQPVERSYSHFLMAARSKSGDFSDFEKLIRTQAEIVASNSSSQTPFPFYRTSLYFRKLKEYFEVFGESNILVCKYEEFEQYPRETLRTIFSFIGVDPSYDINLGKKYRVGRAGIRSRTVKMWIHGSGVPKHIVKSLLPQAIVKKMRDLIHILNHRPKSSLDPQLKARLNEYFREDILATEMLTGLDLRSWLE